MTRFIIGFLTVLLCASMLLVQSGCAGDSEQTASLVVDEGGEDESRFAIEMGDDIPTAENVECGAICSEDGVTGFSLSFDWSQQADELLRTMGNVYFIRYSDGDGDNTQTIPMEYVKIVNNRPSSQFTVTADLPQGMKASEWGRVCLCVASVAQDTAQVLFTAEADYK